MATELTARQTEVINVLIENQGNVIATAEQLKCDRSNVYSIMAKKNVQEHMQRTAMSALSSHMFGAVATIGRLSKTAKSEYVMLEASKAVLDRVGLAEAKQDTVLAIQINLDTTG